MGKFVFVIGLRLIWIMPVCCLLTHWYMKWCSTNVRMKNAIPADTAPVATPMFCLEMSCAL